MRRAVGPVKVAGGPVKAAIGPVKTVGGIAKAVAGPSKVLAGPSKAVAGSSKALPGPTKAVAGPSKALPGPAKVGGGAKVAGGKNKPYSRAEPIATGEFLTDLTGKQWKIGKSIGVGGFGEIYLASDDMTKPVSEKTAFHVIKIEPFTNGPLFVEIAVYLRMAKTEMIEEWKKSHKMDSLGMPNYVSSGSHEYKSQRYRFLVIPRYGQDLHKILESKPMKRFSCRCVQTIALQIVDVLEYIHSRDYIHGDIKASNLLLGLEKKQQLYLLDFGLGSKFVDHAGVHEVYSPDNRKAHNGTLEYTSRDAHIGAFSRRGDLEILGYNMLEWLCGKLPWSGKDSAADVSKQKIAFMNSVQLNRIYPSDIVGLDICEKYLRYVATLTFDQKPNYNQCREILKKGLPSKLTSLYLEDSLGTSPKKKRSSQTLITPGQADNDDQVVTKKIKLPEDDSADVKRATRTTKKVKDFNWACVLSSNPEKIIRSQNNSVCTTPTEIKISPLMGIPTPAMLQILTKRKENVQNSVAVRFPSSSDLQESSGPTRLTDAMKDILMRTKKKKLRKSISESDLSQLKRFQLKKPTFMTPSPVPVPTDPAESSSSIATTISSRQARHLRRNQ